MPTSETTGGAIREVPESVPRSRAPRPTRRAGLRAGIRARLLAVLLVPSLALAVAGCPGPPRPVSSGPAAAEGAGSAPQVVFTEPLSGDVRARLLAGLAKVGAGEADADSLLALLAEAGYLRASLRRAADGAWTVSPGPRAVAASVRWLRGHERPGAPAPPPVPGLSWQDGVWEGLDRELGGILERYDREGYPLTRIEWADFRGDSILEIDTRCDPGPRVRVTGLEFAGRYASRPGFLRRVAGWQGPEWYRGDRWKRAREELIATGLFEEVDGPYLLLPPARPPVGDAQRGDGEDASGAAGSAARGESGPHAGEDALAPDSLDAVLLYRLAERPSSRVSGVLAYSNRDETGSTGGMTGFLDLALGNLLGTGRATRLYWQSWGAERSTFEIFWHEPFLWRIPVGVDASLRHVQEDTLYAETSWEADLVWSPAPQWRIAVGWGQARLALGEPLSRSLNRATTRFRVAYREDSEMRRTAGWAATAEVAQSDGDEEVRRSARLRLEEWVGRSWRLQLRQETGILSGADSLLRGDAFVLGGSQSLRGSAEGEIRAFSYAIQRTELGPRIDARGSRVYLLADVGWIEPWTPGADLLRGRRAESVWRWAAGVGVEVPSRAGRFRLEYAVPGGESPWRGRLHFGVVGAF